MAESKMNCSDFCDYQFHLQSHWMERHDMTFDYSLGTELVTSIGNQLTCISPNSFRELFNCLFMEQTVTLPAVKQNFHLECNLILKGQEEKKVHLHNVG